MATEGRRSIVKYENQKQRALCDALEDLKRLQDLLTNSWSKYYGHLFTKIVGSDTIPFFLLTTESSMMRIYDSKMKLETCYFRIEAVEKSKQQITLSLLRALDSEENETNVIKDIVRLEKTDSQVTINLRSILAVQLLEPALLSRDLYVEKW